MVHSHLLAAIVAPGSVEAEVGRLQAGIFSASGILSAQALPPFVPLAFLPPGAELRGILAAMDHAVSAPWRMRTTGAAWSQGFLFLTVESGGAWAALRAQALSSCGAEAQGLFPAFEGFFMGCGEATEEQRGSVSLDAPPIAFTSAQLAFVRIESPRADGQWWRQLYWETLDERPLRGRRQA